MRRARFSRWLFIARACGAHVAGTDTGQARHYGLHTLPGIAGLWRERGRWRHLYRLPDSSRLHRGDTYQSYARTGATRTAVGRAQIDWSPREWRWPGRRL